MTDDTAATTNNLFEAMETLRAMRHLEARPVPRAAIERLIFYATRAASGGNRQNWAFVVVTEREKVAAIGRLYREGSEGSLQQRLDEAQDEGARRVYASALHLARHMGEAPCLILVCQRGPLPDDRVSAAVYYGSIFPAAQNLMLAARALGLGATLTTMQVRREPELKALLGLPDDVHTVCLIPVGYPVRPFSRVKNRRDPGEVTHWEGW
ncbi:MAG: nitroreductase family protein [Chloroflexi bacterium]|nr:nitroreductase family protein [Chloroflexota bacterium]